MEGRGGNSPGWASVLQIRAECSEGGQGCLPCGQSCPIGHLITPHVDCQWAANGTLLAITSASCRAFDSESERRERRRTEFLNSRERIRRAGGTHAADVFAVVERSIGKARRRTIAVSSRGVSSRGGHWDLPQGERNDLRDSKNPTPEKANPRL